MVSFGRNKGSAERSFLPEDYLEKRAERRTNFLALTLFLVVMVGVTGAFLVTNRQWNDVRHYQEAINVRYSQAAQEIEQLKTLEAQKAELLGKAELTTALIERVPRTILLAEIINRMTEDMTILEFELKSKRIASLPSAITAPVNRGSASITRTSPNAAATMSAPAVTAPEYHTKVIIIGVTTNHNNVAKFGAALQEFPLLANVELMFSEVTKIKSQDMNKFRIEADIRRGADARRLESVRNPRLNGFGPIAGDEKDPTSDESELNHSKKSSHPLLKFLQKAVDASPHDEERN